MLDPSNPDVVYAAMYARRRQPWSFASGGFGDKGGIFKSVDAGRTFKKLGGGLPSKTGRIGLALFAKEPGHLWAVVESDDAGTVGIDIQQSKAGGIFRSTDGGDHWKRVNALSPRSFYFSKIIVDPKDENRIYIPGYGLAISDDGGKSFRGSGAELPHGDIHSIVVDPADTDRVLMGTDGGVYESRDRASTWRYIDNLAIGQFYELGLGMDDPYTVCGGLQDNGTWCGPSRGGFVFGADGEDKKLHISNQDWTFVWGGDGYYVQIDPRDSNLVYAESQEGWAGRRDRATGRFKILRPIEKEGSERFRFNWDSPIVLSKHDPDVLYLGGNNLFKLTRKGESWESISPDLTNREVAKITTVGSGAENHGTIVALAESPLQKGLIWAGTDDGNAWLTRDEGKTWENLSAKLPAPKGTWVSRFEASHFEPGVALASFDGHRTGDNRPYLFETRDFGKSWRSLASELPDGAPVKVVREDPSNASLLFAGTERGLWLSIDRGAHWISMRGESFPAVMVHDLQIHPRDRDLVIGTHGRSIYVIDDITGLEQLTPDTMAKPFALFTPRPATGQYLQPREGLWGNDRWGAKNPPSGASFNYWLRERRPEGVKLEVTDAAGHKVRELKGPGEAGLNRITWDLTLEKSDRIATPENDWGLTPFVSAGQYTATMKVGADKQKVGLLHFEWVNMTVGSLESTCC